MFGEELTHHPRTAVGDRAHDRERMKTWQSSRCPQCPVTRLRAVAHNIILCAWSLHLCQTANLQDLSPQCAAQTLQPCTGFAREMRTMGRQTPCTPAAYALSAPSRTDVSLQHQGSLSTYPYQPRAQSNCRAVCFWPASRSACSVVCFASLQAVKDYTAGRLSHSVHGKAPFDHFVSRKIHVLTHACVLAVATLPSPR